MIRRFSIVLAGAAVLALFFGPAVKAEAPSAAMQRQEHEKAAEKKLKDLNTKMDELAAKPRRRRERRGTR